MTNIWWVNQQGAPGDPVVWAPLENSQGRPLAHWLSIGEARVGDVVLNYTDKRIVAISRVDAGPEIIPDPWERDENLLGTALVLDVALLETPIERDQIPLDVRERDSKLGGPFIKSGRSVKQGYFYPVGQELWDAILAIRPEIPHLLSEESVNAVGEGRDDGPVSVIGGSPKPTIAVSRDEEFAGNFDESFTDEYLGLEGPTDLVAAAIVRREQAQLRAELLNGATEAQCGICGRTMPARYLRASHIKPRALASETERLDSDIMMLNCVLGCDQAFECGDIVINEEGLITLRDPEDWFLQAIFGAMEDTRAPAFNEANAKYFAAKNESLREDNL